MLQSSAPMLVDTGTVDNSRQPLPYVAPATPQHYPLVMFFAAKGPETRQYVTPADMDSVYGAITFDERSKYASHTTVLANMLRRNANQMCGLRIVPPDAPAPASIAFFLDVLPTSVNIYARNIDGSIQLDNAGNPVVTGVSTGSKVKWVTRALTAQESLAPDGLTIGAGTQTDPTTNKQSKLYPVFAFKAAYRGEAGNNVGIRIYAPTTIQGGIPSSSMLGTERIYPINVSMVTRVDARTTPVVDTTVTGGSFRYVSLKRDVVESATRSNVGILDVLLAAYNNTTDQTLQKKYGDLGEVHCFHDNINALIKGFHADEIPFIDANSDFTSDPNDAYLFNIISGTNSNGVSYNTYQFVPDTNAVTLTQYSTHWFTGGGDGSLTIEAFESGVTNAMREYLDDNNEVQDSVRHPENFIWDTGFTIPTKYELINLIVKRLDTHVILATHVVANSVAGAGTTFLTAKKPLSLDSAGTYSLATALVTRIRAYPESIINGTPTCRGAVIPHDYAFNSAYRVNTPLTLDVASLVSKFAGASSGAWLTSQDFTQSGTSRIINTGKVGNIPYLSPTNRVRNWSAGYLAPEAKEPGVFYWPTIKTVYPDDTSVLNDLLLSIAICSIRRYVGEAFREHTGTSGISDATLFDRVNKFLVARVSGKFCSKYKIQFKVFKTPEDIARGYSFTVIPQIGANNVATVMSTQIEAYRMAALPTL